MNRINLPYLDHQFRHPKEQAKGMINWFAAYLSDDDAAKLQTISKMQQDLYRWDSRAIPVGANSVSFFNKSFVAANTGMPGDSFTPPTDEHMGIIGINIYQSQGDEIPLSDWIWGVSNPQLRNAWLTITINGVVQNAKIPLTQAIPDLTDRGIGFIPLAIPLCWQGNTNIEVTLNLAQPSTMVLFTNLRIGLQGFGFGA